MATTKLQSRTPEEYGPKYQDHLLEQYKLFVETSQKVSEKRQTSNNYLLTLCSSLVTLFVAFLSTFGHHRWNMLIPIAGLFGKTKINRYSTKAVEKIKSALPQLNMEAVWAAYVKSGKAA